VAKTVRVLPPLALSSPTGTHANANINFNGLIDQSGRNKTKLAHRVAMKTASVSDKRPRRAHTSTVKFEDMNMRMKTKAEPSALIARSSRQPQSVARSESQPMQVELIRKPVGSNVVTASTPYR
jgi:hypothetical protein